MLTIDFKVVDGTSKAHLRAFAALWARGDHYVSTISFYRADEASDAIKQAMGRHYRSDTAGTVPATKKLESRKDLASRTAQLALMPS